MRRYPTIPLMALTVFAAMGSASSEENWPHWRGPSHNGVSQSTNLPERWGPSENIVWKAPLPSWSGGTPIVWGDRIFVTSASKAENIEQAPPPEQRQPQRRGRRGGFRQRRHPGGEDLLLLCLSKKDGSLLWERELDDGNKLSNKHNDSTPSPVTDGEHVWVVTGTGSVTALDMEGNKVWERNLQDEYGTFGLGWGYASSPLLYDGRIIIEVLHGRRTDDPSYIVSLNAKTGAEQWRQERSTDAFDESPDAYTTPAVLRHEGETQIVISGGDYVTGHNPKTGAEVWRAAGLNPRQLGNYRVVASPVVYDGMIYVPTRRRPLLALRAGGSGDITTSHLVWKWDEAYGPDVPTPITDGAYFYMVEDRGKIMCLNAKTGEAIWGPESTADGIVSASPILADGKIYITNEQGVTSVVAAGSEFKLLATNELDGTYTLSSPVVSGSQLFIRTSTHLYCVEK